MAFNSDEDRRRYRRYDTATYEHVRELSCGKSFVHVCKDFRVVPQCCEMLTGAIMSDH